MLPDQRTLPESICFWTFALTWAFYAVGALYIVGPVLAWVLALLVALSLYLGPAIRSDTRIAGPLPLTVQLWCMGMLLMLVTLWIGHSNWNLGTSQTIKSTIGWAKGWAILALFPLAGALLRVRRHVLVRSQSIVGLCTLIILPLLVVAPYVGLPQTLYTSPLKAAGGPGPEYFTVYLYTLDPSTWTPRWQFYAPWSPFAGLLGVVMVLFSLEERSKVWLAFGTLAGLAMILLSQSRMSLVALVVCTAVPRLLPLILSQFAWRSAAIASASLAVLGATLLTLVQDGIAAFKAARADSTRVRETLQRIAYDRWWNEAVWFGHGTVQPGPHIVEFMPIGSHHTWYGLLFVKGVLGLIALIVPFLAQFLVTLCDVVINPRGRLPFSIMLVLTILSFGENIEIEAYLLWPALMVLGIHGREMAADRVAKVD